MPAGNYNFVVEQGATFKKRVTWKDAAGNPQNLTDFTGRMQIRETVESATPEVSLTTENNGITLGGVLGTIDLLISADDTTDLVPGSYKYDLELENALGEVTRLLEGKIKVKPEVTR